MSTCTRVPLEEYLAHSYEPDCEYVDGRIVERTVGMENAGTGCGTIFQLNAPLQAGDAWTNRVQFHLRIRRS